MEGLRHRGLPTGHRCTSIAAGCHSRIERDLGQQLDAHGVGQSLPAALAEEGVSLAMVADEGTHVLDDAGDPDRSPPRHVAGPSRHVLGGQCRGRHQKQLGARKQASQAHLDVASPWGEVDQEVVDTRPVSVLDELLDGSAEDEPAPHDRLVLIGQEPHREHAHLAGPHGLDLGHHLLVLRLHGTLEIEESGDGEPPDVGVEDTDDVSGPGQRHGKVRRHRGLPDAPLARCDPDDPGGARDGSGRRIALSGLPGSVHQDGFGLPAQLTHGDLGRLDALDAQRGPGRILFDLTSKGAGCGGESNLDDGVAEVIDGGVGHHPELDDVESELRVDDAREARHETLDEVRPLAS